MMFELILWPEVQELMEYDWFRKECYLLQAFEDQEHVDSAYFVPAARLKQIENRYEMKNADSLRQILSETTDNASDIQQQGNGAINTSRSANTHFEP